MSASLPSPSGPSALELGQRARRAACLTPLPSPRLARALRSSPAPRLTDLYLLPLLSGQQAALHQGRLSFRPLFAPPYALPVLLLGTEGALEADAAGRLTLRVAFGAISLPAGGLSVGGVAYAGAVDLGPGDSVSWTP